jgi:methionyl-tRNA formyltransferase
LNSTANLKPISAVVFAYHDVGVYCLQALIDAGIKISLVLTHADDPNETIWFASVAKLCEEQDLPYKIIPKENLGQLLPKLQSLNPDYLFSFYYRFMLPENFLKTARIAALNMHGSLLPKYRGRAPVNWAVLHGETKTGATLHVMEKKPDAGDIVSQSSVSIELSDNAQAVFNKVSKAAKKVMEQVLPELLKGKVPRQKNDLALGSYFGGRKPEDGKIDWSQNAIQIYNLIRAVAPPYPGAYSEKNAQGREQHLILAKASLPLENPPPQLALQQLGLQVVDNQTFGICGDGRALQILDWYPN